jgi:hypothetical protein
MGGRSPKALVNLRIATSTFQSAQFNSRASELRAGRKSMGRFDPTMHEPSPIMEQVKKAERGELSPTEIKDLIELLKSQAEARRLAVAAVERPFDPSVGADALVSRGAARAEKAPERDPSGEKKEPEEARPDREQMSRLLSELRELINRILWRPGPGYGSIKFDAN